MSNQIFETNIRKNSLSNSPIMDAMHCSHDRGSHHEDDFYKGHDDIRDKLGINEYNTDNPKDNDKGKLKAIEYSNQVLEIYAKSR